MNGSPMFSFGAYEMKKTIKGLLIAAAGAGLSYVLTEVIPLFEGTSYMVLIPIMSAIVNAAKEYVVNNEK